MGCAPPRKGKGAMSLADELAADTVPATGVRCSVCVWYTEQSEQDQATFDQWLADRKPVAKLHRACQKQGLTTGLCQFQTHVNGIGTKHAPC